MLYNDNDPKVAAWLRELVARGHLAAGTVDARSIEELKPKDCHETTHFFAGIGGWPLALALAGWPADAPVWTGSCPCQPFSAAGRRRGHTDARHLWPVWFRLIAERRPSVVFGEQTASGDGRRWLAGVRADLETLGYAVGAADLCAAGEGAPHIRQRLFWVGVAAGVGSQGQAQRQVDEEPEQRCAAGGRREPRGVADADEAGRSLERRDLPQDGHAQPRHDADGRREPRGLGDADEPGSQGLAWHGDDGNESGRLGEEPAGSARAAGDAGFWSRFDLVPCSDGKARRVIARAELLAHGLPPDVAVLCPAGTFPARTTPLRGLGNAIVPQVAATFVRCVMGWMGGPRDGGGDAT